MLVTGWGGEGFAFHAVGPPVPRTCDVIFMKCNTLSPEALALDCDLAATVKSRTPVSILVVALLLRTTLSAKRDSCFLDLALALKVTRHLGFEGIL